LSATKPMNAKKKDKAALDRSIDILRFWHKVEFFIPFDLDKQVIDGRDADNVRTFSVAELQRAEPWSLWNVSVAAGRKLIGFEVYLGVFKKSDLAEVTRKVIRDELSPDAQDEEDERGDDMKGRTCFARIRLNDQGETQFEEVSVSTVPWALGRLQTHGLAGLDVDAFVASKQALTDALRNFRAGRSKQAATGTTRKASRAGNEESETVASRPLTAAELLALNELFFDWAGYRSEGSDAMAPVIAIWAKTIENRTKAAKENKPPGKEATADGKTAAVDGVRDVPEEADEEDDIGAGDSEIDILNSFYAKDIERAIVSLANGEDCPALSAYLNPLMDCSRIDLYQSAGRANIGAMVRPNRLNGSHWLDDPSRQMSLMQQFAINSAFERLNVEGIFSVNGPPGTGKTTLLREIFAENITRRARALAKFDQADEAFQLGSVTVHFAEEPDPSTVALLREELTGFEMVVVSSNNAAVENVSQEMPKTKALGRTAWRDERGRARFGYLQTIAHKVAAQNAKGECEALGIDDEPWALISCALGKKSNRRAFAERIGFPGKKAPDQWPKGLDPDRHQSIWMWQQRYRGMSYADARKGLIKADQDVARRLEGLSGYAKLKIAFSGQTAETFAAAALQGERQAEQTLIGAQAVLASADQEQRLCARQLETLREEASLIETKRPRWWARLLNRPSCREYRDSVAANTREQLKWLRRARETHEPHLAAEQAVQQASEVFRLASQQLAARRTEWDAGLQALQTLAGEYPQANYPECDDDLELERWQIDGVWRDDRLNQLRSDLFAAALRLHEAWLFEVLKKGGRFCGNVVAFRRLLSGKGPQDKEHALAIWQSLFMVVPVVSSTFASVANQFAQLGPNSFGWLFIDEAGQAVPQAPVGALWRARRAVVVGDPLQIEPVFTVPIRLIEALAKSSNLPAGIDVEPHRKSVQNLADAANALGAEIGSGDRKQWIGSPLRVHRRCVEPMFSVANEIAYDGKMIFPYPDDPSRRLPPAGTLDLGASAWVDVPGPVLGKHVVPAQVELAHRALVSLYLQIGTLPPIYIISPFKRIKDALIDRIADPARWHPLIDLDRVRYPEKKPLRKWCKDRIGTVHTFQGKEQSIVWMVLGCDGQSEGAATWAGQKPNLLNVAMTRAEHRFFMIGDANLWAGMGHFAAAYKRLVPTISPEEFLRRTERAPSPRTS
jgi:hypothetical protein